MKRKTVYLVAFAGALGLAAVLVSVSLLTGGGKTPPKQSGLTGVAASSVLLLGIPQHGAVLGSPSAPVTLVEYADPQCPYCAEWARNAFPAIVRDYVRSGKVKIEYRGLAFVGPGSTMGLGAALAAGREGKLWQTIDLMYVNQGAENSGWLNDAFLMSLAQAERLDITNFEAYRSSPEVFSAIQTTTAQARADGITGTPSFLIGRTGGQLQPLQVPSLDAAGIRPAIESALSE